MKKVLILLVIGMVFFITGCATRLDKHDIDYYIEKYEIENEVYIKSEHLIYLKTELEYRGFDESIIKEYSDSSELMKVVLGQDLEGNPVILFLPYNTKYDVIILSSPFPLFEDLMIEVETYNENLANNSEGLCRLDLDYRVPMNYVSFSNFDYLWMDDLSFFDEVGLSSSLSVKIGLCSIDNVSWPVRLFSYADGTVGVLAYAPGENMGESTFYELFTIEN
ncbi:MAG: hypothetical protein QM489_02830 [Candidatus Izemoplasma sp.]